MHPSACSFLIRIHLENGIISRQPFCRMDWLTIEDEDNQDMQHEYIGELIMQNGFKVRYNNVEVYTDKMRKHMEKIFKSHGYIIQIKYNNTYAHMEITAIKTQSRYLEIALGIGILWALYRIL